MFRTYTAYNANAFRSGNCMATAGKTPSYGNMPIHVHITVSCCAFMKIISIVLGIFLLLVRTWVTLPSHYTNCPYGVCWLSAVVMNSWMSWSQMVGSLNRLLPKAIRSGQWLISEESRFLTSWFTNQQPGLKTTMSLHKTFKTVGSGRRHGLSRLSTWLDCCDLSDMVEYRDYLTI